MDVHYARTEAIQEEIRAQMDAHQERMGASVNAWSKDTKACQEMTEARLEKAKANLQKMKAGLEEMDIAGEVFEERLNKMDAMNLEANPENSEAIVKLREDPKEEPAVKTFGALKKRYGDQHLPAGHCRQLRK
jgi:hypothetical protein